LVGLRSGSPVAEDLRVIQEPPAGARAQTVYLGEHRAVTKTSHGLKLFFDTRDISVGIPIAIDGTWEVGLTSFILGMVRRGDTIVDVGSNIGYYTTLLAAMVGSGGHVHAFEPNPAIIGNLRDSIEVNYLTNVTLREAALTDHVGEVTFYQPARRFGSGNLCGSGLPDDNLLPITVPAMTLDTVFTGDEGAVRLLHMDVETAEPQVVAGGHAFIERQRDMVIVFEVIGQHFRRTNDQSAARMLAYFESTGRGLFGFDAENRLVAAGVDDLIALDFANAVAIPKHLVRTPAA
jgi:FkbM family methyltransferase